MAKRKYSAMNYKGAGKRVAKRAKPGFTRQTGYYGRFAAAGGELKFFDTTKALTSVTVAGLILDDSLNHVPQNNTENGRIGRKIVIKSLHMKGQAFLGIKSELAQATAMYRVIVYLDKQANGATAAVGDILSDSTPTVNSFRNLANKSRFRILYDKTKSITSPGAAADSTTTNETIEVSRPQQFNKRCNIPVEFDASATDGSMTTIRSNNIGVLAIADQANMTFGYTVRIRYSDA